MTDTINTRLNSLNIKIRAYNFNFFAYGQAGARVRFKHKSSTINRHGTEVRMVSYYYIKNKFDPLYPPLLNIASQAASSRNEKWTVTRLYQVGVWVTVRRGELFPEIRGEVTPEFPPGFDPKKYWPSGVVTVALIKVGNQSQKYVVARGDVPEDWRNFDVDPRIRFSIDP